jgi:hypothetical protein
MEDSEAEAKGFSRVENSVTDTMYKEIGSKLSCIHIYVFTYIEYKQLQILASCGRAWRRRSE